MDTGDLHDRPGDKAASLRAMYTLVRRFEPSRRPFLVIGLSALGTSLCEAATLILLTAAATSIAGASIPESLADAGFTTNRMLGLAAVLIVARLVFVWVNARVSAHLATRCLIDTRRQLLDAYVNTQWARQARHEQGVFFDQLASRAEMVGFSAAVLANVMVSFVNVLILAAVAAFLQPLAVLVLVITGLGMSAALRPLNRRTRKRARQYLLVNETFANLLTDLSRNSRELTAYGTGGAFLARTTAQQQQAAPLYQRMRLLSQLTPQVYQTLGLGLAVGGLAIAAAVGGDDVATLGAVVLLLLRGVAYGQQITSATQSINERMPYVSSLTDAIDDFRAHPRPQGTACPEGDFTVILDQISFAFDDHEVLDNVTLDIRPGERVGIVGPSGSGKTTLLQILAGLREPTSGNISVSGLPFDQVSRDWWSQNTALVSQDTDLLTDTVAGNIAMLRDLTPEKIVRAARDAQIEDEIQALGGFEVSLSRERRGLSGGQKQRLAIARALAGDPVLLLLDEPTSALDIKTEGRLQSVLASLQGRTTMVIVAHRLATVAACDRIIVLDGGRIVDEGAPAAVLDRFGRRALGRWELLDDAAE